jgi:hypothetical protein
VLLAEKSPNARLMVEAIPSIPAGPSLRRL